MMHAARSPATLVADSSSVSCTPTNAPSISSVSSFASRSGSVAPARSAKSLISAWFVFWFCAAARCAGSFGDGNATAALMNMQPVKSVPMTSRSGGKIARSCAAGSSPPFSRSRSRNGHALLRLARKHPKSRLVGLELSNDPLGQTPAVAKREGLANLRFVLGDAAKFGEENAYDLVLGFDAIHDQRDPAAVLANLHRALRPGGHALFQDIRAHTHHHDSIGQPLGAFTYAISTFHCMSASLSQGARAWAPRGARNWR